MRRLAVAAGAVALLAVGGVALAQTTGNERIYACVNNGDGTMRQVAGPDVACPKNFHKLSWSAENPPSSETTTYTAVDFAAMSSGDVKGLSVECNDGDVATGGGVENTSAGTIVSSSLPSPSLEGETPTGWFVVARAGDSSQIQQLGVYAVCQHTE
jgi:hypothetical protein